MLRLSAYWLNRVLWVTLVTSLVLVAAYVSLGRYYIRYVEQYQHQLVQHITQYTGLKLSASRLYGQWSQLSPILTMENLQLHSPVPNGEPVLNIHNISFQLDPLGSLLNGSLLIKRLRLFGIHCELEEVDPGKWQLKGYPSGEGETETDFDKLIDLLLSVDAVQLSAAAVRLNYRDGNSALLESKELSLLHEDDFRRLRLQATFDQAANPLLAVIEANGDPRDANNFFAKGYIKLDDVDFTDQLPLIRSFGLNLHDAEVDGEVWVDWLPRRIISIQGAINIPQLDWAAVTDSASAIKKPSVPSTDKPPLENIQLNFRAEKSADNDWQLWLPRFETQWSEQQFSLEQLHVGIHSDHLEVSVPALTLDKLVSQLSSLQVLGDKGQRTLALLSPVGKLNNLHLRVSLQGKQSQNDEPTSPLFVLRANLEQVGLNAWKGAPGAKGLNGFIELAPDYGVVEFDSQELSLHFPVVYKHWLDFNQANGRVRWDIGEKRLTVQSGPMQLQADFGPATGLLSLDLPVNNDQGDPLMTLAIGLRDTAAAHRNQLIPYTLNPGFLKWMAGSVPKGHVVEGAFVYRGSLRPKASNDRTVQLYFDIDDTTLDYHPDWPPLHNIKGEVFIDDGNVNVVTDSATMFGLAIESAKVQVAPVKDGGMWLSVDAKASGDGSDALKVVTQSAIRNTVGDVFNTWILSGPTKASVDLGIPLAGAKQAADINVDVSLNNTQLQIPDYRLHFHDVKGPLQFTDEQGLSSKGITATLYDKPLQVTVNSGSDKSVVVDINGRADMADVATWSRQPALSFVSGQTDFNASIQIRGKGEGIFSVKSELLGVEIDLPEPFNKTKKDSHKFWLNLPLKSDEAMLSMGLENLARLQLALIKGEFDSALLSIETHQPETKSTSTVKHQSGYFTVTGFGPHFELDQWQTVLQRYTQAAQSPPYLQPPSDDSAQAIAIQVKDLTLSSVSALGHQFDSTTVSAQRRTQAWWLAATNNRFSGELLIPDDSSSPYVVDLQRLHFPQAKNGEGLSSVDPTQFADVDLRIADIAFGKEHYGSIAFNVRSDEHGARFENITGNIRGVHIRQDNPGILLWRNVDGQPHSHLTVRLDIGDLAKVLDNWHYEQIIKSEMAIIEVDFQWQGRPDQWQLKHSQGSVYVRVKDGRFLAASETAAGTLKVVGIVNLANIARRLKLDFTDLYKKGITYDKITGRIQLADQQLTIIDELEVKSPSSEFKLRGKADLENQLLDMDMIVTLPVANNLPWIAAIAGGLPTAAGVFVASKLFEDQFDRLSSAIYSVKGDWDNPELKFERVFDRKKRRKAKDQEGEVKKQVDAPMPERDTKTDALTTPQPSDTSVEPQAIPELSVDRVNGLTPAIEKQPNSAVKSNARSDTQADDDQADDRMPAVNLVPE